MIAAVELALLQVLRVAGDDDRLGYRYAVLDTFPDEFEGYLTNARNLRTPAAWTTFLGMADGADALDEMGWNGTARFALVVAASNLRNEQDSRHGDGAVPGSYQLAIDAVRLISRNPLDPLQLIAPITVKGLRLVNRSAQMVKQQLSLIAIELECRLPFGSFAPAEGELGQFKLFHVDWDVPPHGNVTTPLPAEAADAEDLIEVPQ